MARNRGGALAVGIVAGVLVLAGCGGDDSDEPDAPPAAEGQEAKGPPILKLAKAGHPLVQVRPDRRVVLYDRPGGKALKTLGDETEFGSPTAFSVQRERDGWAAVPTPLFENGRLVWVRLDARKLKPYKVFYAVEIDLSEFRTTVLRRGRVVRSFPVSIGKPEAPTPTGRFAVTDTFRGGLNAAYGCCAVALTARQTRLPSGWLGGDRIAIHGTSGTLGAAISHGCVRAANPDVSKLVDLLPPGAPVTIRN